MQPFWSAVWQHLEWALELTGMSSEAHSLHWEVQSPMPSGDGIWVSAESISCWDIWVVRCWPPDEELAEAARAAWEQITHLTGKPMGCKGLPDICIYIYV